MQNYYGLRRNYLLKRVQRDYRERYQQSLVITQPKITSLFWRKKRKVKTKLGGCHIRDPCDRMTDRQTEYCNPLVHVR